MLFLVKAVRLTRVDNQLGLDAVALEAAVKLLALAWGIDRVGVSLENQGRRFDILEVHERRTIQESGELLWLIRDAVEPLIVRRALLGAVFGDEIGQSRAGDGSFEARGLRNRPFRHVAAVRPAADGQLAGISDAPRNEIVDTSHDVTIIAAAPIAAIHLNKFLAVTTRSANIGIKDGVAAPRKELPPRFDGVLPDARRASVDQGDERQFRFGVVADRFQKSRFDFHAVKGFVFVRLRGAERVLL